MDEFIYFFCLFTFIVFGRILVEWIDYKFLIRNFNPGNTIIRYKVEGVKFKTETILRKYDILERKDSYIYVKDRETGEECELDIEEITYRWDKLEVVKDCTIIETFNNHS